jgi:CRISPR-associated endonuclease Cas2
MSRVLIGYDIHDPRRRRRALTRLRRLTETYQYSFYDCQLSAAELATVYEQLVAELEPSEDGVIVALVAGDTFHALGQRWGTHSDLLYLVA